MVVLHLIVLFVGFALAVSDPILRKSDNLRYEYWTDPDGVPHLLDSWLKVSDLAQAARYDPDRDNQYHLFTRQNPSVSQPLLNGNQWLLSQSNFSFQRKIVFVIHGWLGSATANSNVVLVQALLASEDVNVIVVDWSVGATTISFPNALSSGQSVARFINWLSSLGVTGEDLVIIGFSLGGQQAGMVGRHTNEKISYIIVLDPPQRDYDFEVRADDGAYTEVIHTYIFGQGPWQFQGAPRRAPGTPLGQVDFYPNTAESQPGCGTDFYCHHARAYHFLAESLVTGGFTGTECATHAHALNGTCDLPGRLRMGGLTPKTGRTGIYYLETNAAPPFSRG